MPDISEELRILQESALAKIMQTSLDFFLHHHKSTNNQKMTFRYMPYLKDIYFDQSSTIIVKSSVQTGKSEWALIKGLACMSLGLNVFHVFSTGEAKNSFVKSRINELCDKVPLYKSMERDDRRNMYLRNMGKAHWKFVISNSKSHFDEFPADVVVVDELDSCNQENVELRGTRMENSSYKFEWLLGNPTVDNTGIGAHWDKSTKNIWHFKCQHCGEFFHDDFFEIVVREHKDKDGNHISFSLYDTEWRENMNRDIMVRCTHCESLQDREKGKWISQNPESKISGYQISKVMKLSSLVRELWEELQEAEGNDFKMQIFYNKKLGLTYAGTGAKVTADMLDRMAYDYTVKDSSTKPTVAGLDVGSKFDLQIDIAAKHEGKRKRLLLNTFRCNSLEEVKDKIDEFNIKTMCVGIKPERHLMQNFRKDMFGICNIILIEEVEGKSGNLKLIGFKENEDEGVITVDRTWMLDESMRNIKLRRNILPKKFRSLLDGFWLDSMESITRVFQNEKEEYKWSKADKDHFRFADAFSMLAWMKTQEAVLLGDGMQKSDMKEKSKEGWKGNRTIEPPQERRERIGLIKRRTGIGGRATGFGRRFREKDY